MDWFEQLTGFKEAGYDNTRSKLVVEGPVLRSVVNGRSFGIGALELASLASLRGRVGAAQGPAGGLRVHNISGDVRAMHLQPEHAGAVFQVASQFNLLEMVGPGVTPEDGVSGYAHDRTQGPACAMAAGAATVYRNYCVPVGDGIGQTGQRQLDGLADLGAALSQTLAMPVAALWTMRNGYALCTRDGLAAISKHLATLDPAGLDALRGLLRVGVQSDVEVTDALRQQGSTGPRVTQVFCSALPVAYTSLPPKLWRPFAQLVLEAAYEATLCAAVLNARRGASATVLLTRLGGGAFGNDDAWIDAALRRAMTLAAGTGLDIRLVSYGTPSRAMLEMAAQFN